MACRFMAVLRARLGAVSDHRRCFTLERLKSATSKTLGNRSSGSSQSTGSALSAGALLPPIPLLCAVRTQGTFPGGLDMVWILWSQKKYSREKGLALIGHYLGDTRKLQNYFCICLLVLDSWGENSSPLKDLKKNNNMQVFQEVGKTQCP